MIELNLLPDVKLEYIKAQRSRRVVLSISLFTTAVAVTLLVILFSFGMLQKKHLAGLSDDIASSSETLKDKPEIDRVLTVQNQLDKLTALHEKKPASSLLLGYLNQLTPTQVSITELDVNFAESTITISGNTDALSNVNKYIDTIKFTKYQTVPANEDEEPEVGNAFKDVLLDSFALNTDAQQGTKPATYTIKMSFEPVIFDITKQVKLSVPNITPTRINAAQQSDLFEESSTGGVE